MDLYLGFSACTLVVSGLLRRYFDSAGAAYASPTGCLCTHDSGPVTTLDMSTWFSTCLEASACFYNLPQPSAVSLTQQLCYSWLHAYASCSAHYCTIDLYK
jgi:hypothetical protein